MATMPQVPTAAMGGDPSSTGAPDLSGLMGAAPAPDPAQQFMQLAKQLEDQVMAIATAHPKFSKAAEVIKKAIQQGTVEVVGSMKERESTGPAAGLNYLG